MIREVNGVLVWTLDGFRKNVNRCMVDGALEGHINLTLSNGLKLSYEWGYVEGSPDELMDTVDDLEASKSYGDYLLAEGLIV